MKKFILILPVMMLFFAQIIIAQEGERLVQGEVYDDQGEALIGVNVVIAGTTTGTITDVDGEFSINVNPGDQLTFTYVGYESPNRHHW